jgi:hypothetical protein
MKRTLALAFAISFALAMAVWPAGGHATTKQSRICHPTQQQLEACERAGGEYDLSACRCTVIG